jgi:hypothetical protein
MEEKKNKGQNIEQGRGIRRKKNAGPSNNFVQQPGTTLNF